MSMIPDQRAHALPAFKIIAGELGNISSWSTFDLDRVPAKSPVTERDVYRMMLGDVAFVARYDRAGARVQIFYVPEFPEQHFREYARAMGYYGVLLSEYGHELPFELKAWDPGFRPITWDEGMRFVQSLHESRCSNLQRAMVQSIRELDRLSRAKRPNLDRAEMRRRVGTSLGARILQTAVMLDYT
jgi:hypothetical protein